MHGVFRLGSQYNGWTNHLLVTMSTSNHRDYFGMETGNMIVWIMVDGEQVVAFDSFRVTLYVTRNALSISTEPSNFDKWPIVESRNTLFFPGWTD